jgi:hypothetical protein
MMSSEISIEAKGGLPSTARGTLKPADTPTASAVLGHSAADDGFRPWHFFVLASILLATVAVIMARQSAPEQLILISFTIAAAGAAAAALYRMLAPLTAPLVLRMGEPVSERMRTALEREKALVLRSIKELEFDRGMGKVSQADFDEMAARLRGRALSLMKQLDLGSGSYTEVIEKELEVRFPASRAARGKASGVRLVCQCGSGNDPDAVFCKKCGSKLLVSEASA